MHARHTRSLAQKGFSLLPSSLLLPPSLSSSSRHLSSSSPLSGGKLAGKVAMVTASTDGIGSVALNSKLTLESWHHQDVTCHHHQSSSHFTILALNTLTKSQYRKSPSCHQKNLRNPIILIYNILTAEYQNQMLIAPRHHPLSFHQGRVLHLMMLGWQ